MSMRVQQRLTEGRVLLVQVYMSTQLMQQVQRSYRYMHKTAFIAKHAA